MQDLQSSGHKPKKSKSAKLWKKTRQGFRDTLLDRDNFGQPIVLNYKGSDTFKTIPGAFFTIFAQLFVLVVLAQTLFKMVGNEKWILTEQTLILNQTELLQTIDLGNFPNLTLANEMRPGTGSLGEATRDQYENLTSILSRFTFFAELSYLKQSEKIEMAEADSKPFDFVAGYNPMMMFEFVAGHMQSQPDVLPLNGQNLREMQINLTNSFLAGSESATTNIPNKYVSFILAQNSTAQYEAYEEECGNHVNCSNILVSDSTVFNFYMDWIHCQEENLSLNTTQMQAWIKFYLEDFKRPERTSSYRYSYYHDFEHKTFSSPSPDKCTTMKMQFMAASTATCVDEDPTYSSCMYKQAKQEVDNLVNTAIASISMKPVLYDEITKFENGANTYPFQKRKSKLPEVKLDSFPRGSVNMIPHFQITLQKNEVCLDNNIFSQFFIYDDEILNKCDHTNDFEILQMSEFLLSDKEMVVPAFLMITLTLDNQKRHSIVESYKFFDMIGDIGGFLEGLLLLFSFFVSPISQKLYEYRVAEEFYKGHRSQFERPAARQPSPRIDSEPFEGGQGEASATAAKADKKRGLGLSQQIQYPPPPSANPYLTIRNSFQDMKLGACFKFLEPIAGCCFCGGWRKKRKFARKAMDKFEDELDIDSLLRKIRVSDQMWRSILRPEQLKLLNFSKANTISLEKRKKNKDLNEDSISFSESTSEEELFGRVFKDVQGGWIKQDPARLVFNEAVFQSVPFDTAKEQALVASHLFSELGPSLTNPKLDQSSNYLSLPTAGRDYSRNRNRTERDTTPPVDGSSSTKLIDQFLLDQPQEEEIDFGQPEALTQADARDGPSKKSRRKKKKKYDEMTELAEVVSSNELVSDQPLNILLGSKSGEAEKPRRARKRAKA